MTDISRVPAKLAVLGSPIAHSRSPRIHLAAYEVLGLEWSYVAKECGVDALTDLLAGSGPEWRGYSVTMPLKEAAFQHSLVLDPVARESGVVNTLFRLISHEDTPKWAGFNTDVTGLSSALRSADFDLTHTVVLGAGATAVSAVLAARLGGAREVTVLARRAEAAQKLSDRFHGSHEQGTPQNKLTMHSGILSKPTADTTYQPFDTATAVISTLPGNVGFSVGLPRSLMRLPLFDVAYDPWPSPLAQRWEETGGTAHAGIDMLLEQALVQVRIFVNGDPGLPLEREDEVRAAMHDAGVGR